MAQRFGSEPTLRFFIGDVRDEKRLRTALDGIDVVIHAAAMKQVPACEYNPIEAVKTNVGGAQNVIESSIAMGVGYVIAIGTDKNCVDYYSKVSTKNGASILISSLVTGEVDCLVETFIDGRITHRRVNGWHKNSLDGRDMYNVTYEGAYHHIGIARGVVLTGDHPILTTTGWVRADCLTSSDILVTNEVKPNHKQLSFICGKILGDAHLSNSRRSSIAINQTDSEWVKVCHRVLQPFGANPIRVWKRTRELKPQHNFRVSSSAWLVKMRSIFYPDGKKVVPRELISELWSPELLAAWYMDDGCISEHRYARLATHGFTKDDVFWIADEFNKRGVYVNPRLQRISGTDYWGINFTKPGSDRLFEIVGRYVIPTMRYKLPDWAPSFDSDSWELGEPEVYTGRAIVNKLPKYKSKDVYCIDVEDGHNFVVNGVIVHNCLPYNLYGATKLVSEKLFVQAKALSTRSGTKFATTRYGNVIGSRGSVVELFQKQKATGRITITDPRMTRFLLTVRDGVNFVLGCVDRMRGGEVFVPKLRSARLTDIAEVVAPGCEQVVVGIRPGEKLHEALISPDEFRNTREYDTYYVIEPQFAFWGGDYAVPKPGLPEGSMYSSDTNLPFLTLDEIRDLIGTV
jgi:nucleoside-diphosphate-sugar epimerase